jgi:subtilisin family serine protease
VLSLAPDGGLMQASGTSIAVPFVAGAAALLWSMFPAASAAVIKHALLFPGVRRRKSITPPLLDAWASFLRLSASHVRREAS